ncbi:MAG: polysaccharide deacetylase family protein [Pirellulaceae bacterium]
MSRCVDSAHLIACLIALLGNTAVCNAQAPPARYLIIHGDDAGMSHSANMGTIDAMEKGVVSSASIMVPCPWFLEIAEYARAHPERDFGVHLTLNCEWKRYRWGPVASRDKVPSLIDQDGYLWSDVEQVGKNAKTEEVEIELRAQIERAKQFAVPITHLDTHMGSILARPDLVGIYVKLALEYDVPILFLGTVDTEMAKEYPALAAQGQKLLPLLREHRFPLLDQMTQLYGEQPGLTRPQAYLETLRRLQPGVSQLIIHCGYDDAELRAITGSAPQRDEDRRVFSDPAVINLIKEQGIQVIGWKQFREMQKSQ